VVKTWKDQTISRLYPACPDSPSQIRPGLLKIDPFVALHLKKHKNILNPTFLYFFKNYSDFSAEKIYPIANTSHN
jgi:hypothetical protein